MVIKLDVKGSKNLAQLRSTMTTILSNETYLISTYLVNHIIILYLSVFCHQNSHKGISLDLCLINLSSLPVIFLQVSDSSFCW